MFICCTTKVVESGEGDGRRCRKISIIWHFCCEAVDEEKVSPQMIASMTDFTRTLRFFLFVLIINGMLPWFFYSQSLSDRLAISFAMWTHTTLKSCSLKLSRSGKMETISGLFLALAWVLGESFILSLVWSCYTVAHRGKVLHARTDLEFNFGPLLMPGDATTTFKSERNMANNLAWNIR